MFILILPSIVPAQKWAAWYNGPGNGSDGGNALAVDSASNVYITGSSNGVGSLYDCAIIKYSSSGVEQWVARYDRAGNYYNKAQEMVIDDIGYTYVIGRVAEPTNVTHGIYFEEIDNETVQNVVKIR